MADFAPTHPGEVLLEDFLKPMGLSQYALAKALQVPQIRISEIVAQSGPSLRYGAAPGTAFRHQRRILDRHAGDL
jgi:addiction module HigA family antidote